MAGIDVIHDFLEIDRGSDDEAIENSDELEVTEGGQLQHCNANTVVNGNINLIEPSTAGLSAECLEPYVGMAFPSLDDARDFYYDYAKCMGFTIRTNRIRHSLKNMAIIGRDFVCSREGFRAAKHTLRKDRILPPRPITREGCKAMIRLAVREGKWVVTKFEREHNHKLMTHCKFSGELPIVNILNEEEKDKRIQDLYDELEHERERSAALRQQLCLILKDIEEHAQYMSLRVEDIVNSVREIELGDVQF